MKKSNKTQSGTNIEEVRQQNAQSAGGAGAQGNFGAEFGSETDAQQVKKQNQQAESKKAKNSGNFGQQ
ncbi:gamma-type small acid-soluble spore protein [Lederbergia lenta]|uniref:Small, acid-soluble spore protein gamma-type n=1 Tax=Lederbergia lenta TaxID=1467 RepID=A0A2X4ZL65_LEDLE|nr:gamma-type small acid-soluble spore protein [Lederbergia lenta]MCM3113374.1 gamma-type small acid-soluble spore protein [Lederbergia lenta]MEC2326481.1 gamma-type small acid-soluble spore protein [Lederbergia lenta]SQI61194.1 small, acid-soluble spore protein, gamma-type [Lederbergia lenta]